MIHVTLGTYFDLFKPQVLKDCKMGILGFVLRTELNE